MYPIYVPPRPKRKPTASATLPTPQTATPLAEAIASFCESCRIDRGASKLTLASYQTDLDQFAAFLAAQTPSVTSEIDVTHAQTAAWLAELRSNGLAATSMARKLSALRQFFKFCCLERELEHNPTDGLESPQLTARLPHFLTHEQIQVLLAAVDQGLDYPGETPELADALRARDRAIIYSLYAAGLRISELTSLTTGSIERGQRYFRVVGKRSKTRIAPYTEATALLLEHYLDHERGKLTHAPRAHATHAAPSERVFLNRSGEPLSRQSIWKMLKDFAFAADLSADLSPHDLRHSFATHLLQRGMNLRSLQMLLGHADLSTTQIYTHVTPEHLKDAHQAYHPRANARPAARNVKKTPT